MIVPLGRTHSRRQAYAAMADMVAAAIGSGKARIGYLHAGALQEAQKVKELVEAKVAGGGIHHRGIDAGAGRTHGSGHGWTMLLPRGGLSSSTNALRRLSPATADAKAKNKRAPSLSLVKSITSRLITLLAMFVIAAGLSMILSQPQGGIP